jgi:hypothetical protein
MALVLRFTRNVWPRLTWCRRAPVSVATFLLAEDGTPLRSEDGEVLTIE